MSTVTTNELKRYGLPEDDTVMFEQFLNDMAGYNVEKMDSEITRLDAAIDGKLKLNNENLSNVNMTLSPNGDSINGIEVKSIGVPKLYKKSKVNSGEWIEIAYTEARDLVNYSYKFMY